MTRAGSRIRLCVPLAALIAVAYLILTAAHSDASQIAPESKISDTLRQAFAANPKADLHFLVVLGQQADISNNIVDWTAKGRYVFDKLKQQAAATQGPVATALEAQLKLGTIKDYKSYYIINAFGAHGTQAAVTALAQLSAVARIDAFPRINIDPVVKPNTAQLKEAPQAVNAVEWNVSLVHAPQAWALGYNGAGITVGSLDTGVRYTHQALVNKYRGKLANGAFDHNFNWWDSIRGTPVPYDPVTNVTESGHGSHTMGTVLGDDGHGNQIGVAPGANWIATNGVGDGTTDPDIIESGEFLLAPWDLNGQNANPDKRPHVISNSWGYGNSLPYPGCATVEFYHDVVRAWVAAGIFPSFSAGNSFPQGNRPPAAYPETFETGALRNPANGLNMFASYSSEGPSCYDNGQMPQLMAGGGDAGADLTDFVRSSFNDADDSYSYQAGSSMAQPATAGAVAILKQVNPNLTIQQTWYILTSTTTFDPAWALSCGPRPNICYGWGTLQIDAAVRAALLTVPTATRTATVTITPTKTRTRTATATRTITRTPAATLSPTRTTTRTATRTATPQPAPGRCQSFTWIDVVNAVVGSGNSLTKTGGGGWTAGAASNLAVRAGSNGAAQIVIADTTHYLLFGLSNGNTDAGPSDVDFGLETYPPANQLWVMENNQVKAKINGYAAGDELRVAVFGSKVYYYRNGIQIAASSATPTFPLLFDSSLGDNGAKITTPQLCSGQLTPVPSQTPTATRTVTRTATPTRTRTPAP